MQRLQLCRVDGRFNAFSVIYTAASFPSRSALIIGVLAHVPKPLALSGNAKDDSVGEVTIDSQLALEWTSKWTSPPSDSVPSSCQRPGGAAPRSLCSLPTSTHASSNHHPWSAWDTARMCDFSCVCVLGGDGGVNRFARTICPVMEKT